VLDPVRNDPLDGQRVIPPPPVEVDGKEEYQGSTVEDSQIISKMYFSHWKTLGVSERMWSVNLDASNSGECQTFGGHSGRPSE